MILHSMVLPKVSFIIAIFYYSKKQCKPTNQETHIGLGLRILSGQWPFKKGASTYTLHSGDGERIVMQHVPFVPGFHQQPLVLSFLYGLGIYLLSIIIIIGIFIKHII
jgi:hypothetical protein